MATQKYGFYFKDWLKFYGPARLAEELGVHKGTIAYWMRGGPPSGPNLRKIKKISKGRVDYVHMLDGDEIKQG